MSLTLPERFTADAQAVLEPLDLDQYYRMMEAGVIVEGSPIELIDGLLIRKDRRDNEGDIVTIGTRRVLALELVAEALAGLLPRTIGHVRRQQPIHLGKHDAPEPDVSVALGGPRNYAVHHPSAAEIALVVEVADSSLDFDLGRKLELYRQAGIPEYWVVNLRDNRIELFRGPQPDGWCEHAQLKAGQILETVFAEVTVSIAVDDVLPN